jgi:hypothetical protein
MLDPKSPKAPYKQNSHLQSGTAKKDMEMPSASTAEKVMEMPSVLRSNVLRIKKIERVLINQHAECQPSLNNREQQCSRLLMSLTIFCVLHRS